uniref:Zinc finger C2HC domain-containing protein 1A n=1 Tax=Paramormyrops kingsleyae TaxID=1676925 RepID=A0A3B3QM61_9TELE
MCSSSHARDVPDYIQCPYCQRRFSENAADRHIKFCKEQAARMPNKGKVVAADTKAKPPARSQVCVALMISARVNSLCGSLMLSAGFWHGSEVV